MFRFQLTTLSEKLLMQASKTCLFPPKKISFMNSIRLIRTFLLTKREEYIANGQQVENELKKLIRQQVLPKRPPDRKYLRKTKNGKYRKYK